MLNKDTPNLDNQNEDPKIRNVVAPTFKGSQVNNSLNARDNIISEQEVLISNFTSLVQSFINNEIEEYGNASIFLVMKEKIDNDYKLAFMVTYLDDTHTELNIKVSGMDFKQKITIKG